jgi:hypothetical protein
MLAVKPACSIPGPVPKPAQKAAPAFGAEETDGSRRDAVTW